MVYTSEQVQLSFPSPGRLFRPAVTVTLVLLAAGSLLFKLAPDFAKSFFALSAGNVLHGRIWQLVTFPFVSDSLLNVIFSGLMVLFVGGLIEQEWGALSFVQLWLVTSVVSGLIWVVVNLVAGKDYIGMGTSACTYGLIATMGLLFRNRKFFLFFFTVEARYLVLILIATGVLMNLREPINIVWISGALAAYVYTKLCWKLGGSRGRKILHVEKRRSGDFVDID